MNETLKLMWDTRPPRIPKKQGGDAMIAGICEGIGVRYHIDPTLVRVAFAALSLVFGVGLFVYTLCGFLMPRFGLSTSPAQAISTPKHQLDAVEVKERDTGWGLLILLFIFFPTISAWTWADATASTLGGLALSALAWWALHQRQPEPPAGLIVPSRVRHPQPEPGAQPQPEPQPEQQQPVDPIVTARFTAPEGYPHPAHGRTTPPSWDPLGTAPQLWHLPDPGYEPPQQARMKPNRPLWIWIPVAVLLTVSVFLTMAVGSNLRNRDWSGFGQTTVVVSDEETIFPIDGYVGELNVDLTDLPPLKEPAALDINHKVGTVNVTMPKAKIPYEVNCSINVGETACPPSSTQGEGETLTLNIHEGVGRIQVTWPE
ncbi:PspC domain-containing protein [Corynebacterium sp. CCUG 71335]|uniref:PspC domain-containing protein n=1 Tax=Corynebacterium sp. CCUG 71335 TaxID=2823892 RepID=UPI00210C25C6|nr:PspC domain-containing protein [Corynebacterium sp. CCUG 71335]MCQ4620984.1 PspC domain-containing protein [Corynebacterium sp. CCUG 71335]